MMTIIITITLMIIITIMRIIIIMIASHKLMQNKTESKEPPAHTNLYLLFHFSLGVKVRTVG